MWRKKLDNIVNLFSPPSLKDKTLKIGKGSEKFLVDLIKQRLYEEGTDCEGKALRTDWGRSQGTSSGYSRNTVTIKNTVGQKSDNVTLRDSGATYESFKTAFTKDEYKFSSVSFNIIYENFKDSFSSANDMQQKVVNLDEAELDIFIWKIIQPALVRELKKDLR